MNKEDIARLENTITKGSTVSLVYLFSDKEAQDYAMEINSKLETMGVTISRTAAGTIFGGQPDKRFSLSGSGTKFDIIVNVAERD